MADGGDEFLLSDVPVVRRQLLHLLSRSVSDNSHHVFGNTILLHLSDPLEPGVHNGLNGLVRLPRHAASHGPTEA